MANPHSAPIGQYKPDMDGASHEAMYRNFTHFVPIATVFVACIVAGLAVGAVHAAWTSTIVMVVLAHIALAIGLLTPLGARAPGAVLVLLLLMLLLY
jgi:hypothetical protein